MPVYFAECEDADAEDDVPPENRKQFRQQVIDSYIGLTSADFCMADTAAMVMRTRPGQARSVSLVPSIHIAVIGIDQIVAKFKRAFHPFEMGCRASNRRPDQLYDLYFRAQQNRRY